MKAYREGRRRRWDVHQEMEQAFDRADAALYRAKSGGKNLCIAA